MKTLEIRFAGKSTEIMVKEFTAPSILESVRTAIRCIGFRGDVSTYEAATALYLKGCFKDGDLVITMF